MSGIIEVLMFLGLLDAGGSKAGPPPPPPPPPPAPGPYPGPAPAPSPAPSPRPAPAPPPHVMPIGPFPPRPAPKPGPKPKPGPPPRILPIQPGPWPSPVKPATLPPFPGPGWVACAPLSAAIISRASALNPQLWNFPTQTIRKAFTQEQLGGQWITFAAAWHPDQNGTPHKLMATEAWCLAAGPAPGPSPSPSPAPSGIAAVGPEPELGGWKTDAPFIRRYQAALAFLSYTRNQPTWKPPTTGVVDAATMAAVMAFQGDNGIAPIDGEVGSQTASVIDTMMGYQVPPGGYPPPHGGAAPAPAPMPVIDPGDQTNT